MHPLNCFSAFAEYLYSSLPVSFSCNNPLSFPSSAKLQSVANSHCLLVLFVFHREAAPGFSAVSSETPEFVFIASTSPVSQHLHRESAACCFPFACLDGLTAAPILTQGKTLQLSYSLLLAKDVFRWHLILLSKMEK